MEQLLAVILMHFDSFCSKYGANHVVMRAVITKANNFSYNARDLTHFGGLITADYLEMNRHANVPEHLSSVELQLAKQLGEMESAVRQNLEQVKDVHLFTKSISEGFRRLEDQNNALHAKVDEILLRNAKVDEILAILRNATALVSDYSNYFFVFYDC